VSVRCGRSVADPPDDQVVVDAAGEVAERVVELSGCSESLQPEQLLVQRADEAFDAAVASGPPDARPTLLDAEGLELFMVSCTVPSSPKRVSQETLQRTNERSAIDRCPRA
jgi:hypothetical protein